jgi:hypothetical protein
MASSQASGVPAPRPGVVLAARVVYGAVALAVAVGLAVQITLIFTGGTDANSGASGTAVPLATRLVRLFSFFTIQSNIVVCVVAALMAMDPRRDGRGWRVAQLDALLGIIITGVVYDIMLAPLLHLTGWAEVATILLHYVSPWLAVIAWVLFGPRRRLGIRTAAAAFIWPVVWLVYTFAHGAVTNWYPYPFLDAGHLGFAQALVNAVMVLVAAVVLAAEVMIADRFVPALLSPRVGSTPQPASVDPTGPVAAP